MKTPAPDAASDAGKQKRLDHPARPVLKYSAPPDMAGPSFWRLYRKLHQPHHQSTRQGAHIDQCHKQPSTVNDHPKPAAQQMEILAAFLKVKGPAYDLPYDAHQLPAC